MTTFINAEAIHIKRKLIVFFSPTISCFKKKLQTADVLLRTSTIPDRTAHPIQNIIILKVVFKIIS